MKVADEGTVGRQGRNVLKRMGGEVISEIEPTGRNSRGGCARVRPDA